MCSAHRGIFVPAQINYDPCAFRNASGSHVPGTCSGQLPSMASSGGNVNYCGVSKCANTPRDNDDVFVVTAMVPRLMHGMVAAFLSWPAPAATSTPDACPDVVLQPNST